VLSPLSSQKRPHQGQPAGGHWSARQPGRAASVRRSAAHVGRVFTAVTQWTTISAGPTIGHDCSHTNCSCNISMSGESLACIDAFLHRPSLCAASATPRRPDIQFGRAHELFKELIEINTTESVGSVTAASEAMGRAPAGGRVSRPAISRSWDRNDRKKNLAVRCTASGKPQTGPV